MNKTLRQNLSKVLICICVSPRYSTSRNFLRRNDWTGALRHMLTGMISTTLFPIFKNENKNQFVSPISLDSISQGRLLLCQKYSMCKALYEGGRRDGFGFGLLRFSHTLPPYLLRYCFLSHLWASARLLLFLPQNISSHTPPWFIPPPRPSRILPWPSSLG